MAAQPDSSPPTVTLIDDAGEVRILFGYNAQAIRRLKDLGDCRWDPDDRCWWTRSARRDAVAAVFESLGYEVIDDVHRRRDSQPGALATNPAESYLRSLPSRLQPTVFRSLAMILHPDRGGDPGAMVQLNTAWDRLKVAS